MDPILKQILEQKGYDVSQTNIIPFTYEEAGIIKTGSFLVGSEANEGVVSMYPKADIGMSQTGALVFKPKETSIREEIVLEDQQAVTLIQKNALPLDKKNELLARAESARQRGIVDNNSYAQKNTTDQNLNEFANSVRNILTSVDPNPGAITKPYDIIDPPPTQEEAPPSPGKLLRGQSALGGNQNILLNKQGASQVQQGSDDLESVEEQLNFDEKRTRRQKRKDLQRNTQNQIPVADETPTVQDPMDSSEELLDMLAGGRSQEELEAQVAKEFDIGNDQFLMDLMRGQTEEQQEQVLSEQLDNVKVSDDQFDYNVNTSTEVITATRKSDGKVFENLQTNPEAKAAVDKLVVQERERKTQEAVKVDQEREEKENKERLLAMAKSEEDFQQVREAAGEPPDTDPKMVKRKLPPMTESQKTGLIFAGLAGLDVGLEAAKALGPARQEARQQIKQLEALREQGRLGEDKAEDAETMRLMTRPIRAIAEQQERERQAVMAGMGQTRSAGDLARLRRERDELIDQSLARAGAQVSAQRMQRAEQDLQKLQQLQQYRQSNIEATADRIGQSAQGIAQGIGMSRAAQADAEGIEDFVNSYSQSLLEFGGAETEQEAKEKAVKEFYNKKPKDEDFLTKYITGLGS
jgi:hypothetical protein